MTESRLRTILLILIVTAASGFISYEAFFSSTKLSLSTANAESASKIALSAKLAHEKRKAIPLAIKEYAAIKGAGIGYDKICGQYNYNDAGIKQHEASITETLGDFDPIELNKLAYREAKKFIDMNQRLSREQREAKCAEAWALYGADGTAIPNYLIKAF